MDEHTHGPNGEIIYAEPAPVAVEAEAVETAAGASVEIAKIEAQTEVALSKETTKREQAYTESEVAELRAENRVLREMLDKLGPLASAPEPDPEPEPVPVVVDAPEEEDTAPGPEPVDPGETSEPEKPKNSRGFWGPAYR